MKWSTLRNGALLSVTAASLSGCLMLSALFGASSFVLTGPAQYIGTVYSVGEYTYEYAVNDKTPDMVIKDKLAWLTPEKRTAPGMTVRLAQQENVHVTAASLPLPAEPVSIAQPLVRKQPPRLHLAATTLVATPTRTGQTAKHTHDEQRLKKSIGKTLSTATNAPLATHAKPALRLATAPEPPPARLIQLQRMESSFHAADHYLDSGTEENSVRISLPSERHPGGINGSWRIRHRIS